jgi:hypothetical protein
MPRSSTSGGLGIRVPIVICQVNFPSDWISASVLEEGIRGDREPHGEDSYETRFLFPADARSWSTPQSASYRSSNSRIPALAAFAWNLWKAQRRRGTWWSSLENILRADRQCVSYSGTLLDGYVALLVYRRGNRLKVAVSDSGFGIM